MDGFSLIILVALGVASGLVMSLVGASAVMVIVPGLSILLGYGMHMAIGVSLLVDVLASLVVGYSYYRHGNVELSQGVWIAIGSVVGAQFGAVFNVAIPVTFLAISYGLWMVGAGATIWRKGLDRTVIARRFARYFHLESPVKKIIVSLILGVVIGVNAGIFGAGGGVLIMMVLIFVFEYQIHNAVGTSTIIMAMTAASATIGYVIQGNINVFDGFIVSFGTIAGGLYGARFANMASEKALAKVVGGIFIVLGVFMTVLRVV